jgi:hypothetical protein
MAESRQTVGQPMSVDPVTAEVVRRIERTDQAKSQHLSASSSAHNPGEGGNTAEWNMRQDRMCNQAFICVVDVNVIISMNLSQIAILGLD